jgi:hypothetical protein
LEIALVRIVGISHRLADVHAVFLRNHLANGEKALLTRVAGRHDVAAAVALSHRDNFGAELLQILVADKIGIVLLHTWSKHRWGDAARTTAAASSHAPGINLPSSSRVVPIDVLTAEGSLVTTC